MATEKPWVNLRSWRLWLGVVLASTLIGLIEGTQVHIGTTAAGRPLEWERSFASTMPSWYMLAALLPGILWLAARFGFEPGAWKRSAVIHMAAAVLFAALHIAASSYISDYILYRDFPLGFAANLSRLLGIYFVIELFFYWAIVGAYNVGEYANRYRERERIATQLSLKASRLETSLARAHLESLRMQLNPHFLFNTLNAISVLALKGEKHSVVRTLTLLSDLLRVSLENAGQVVALREDIALLQRYLEIEQIRFKDRLTVRFDVTPDALDAEVPTLALQPIVENAIRHGISQKPGVGRIDIRGFTRDGYLVLEVQDTGPGITGTSNNAGSGIGLANTRARLEQLYAGDHTMTLENAPEGGALVRIEIPLRTVVGDVLTGSSQRAGQLQASRSA